MRRRSLGVAVGRSLPAKGEEHGRRRVQRARARREMEELDEQAREMTRDCRDCPRLPEVSRDGGARRSQVREMEAEEAAGGGGFSGELRGRVEEVRRRLEEAARRAVRVSDEMVEEAGDSREIAER